MAAFRLFSSTLWTSLRSISSAWRRCRLSRRPLPRHSSLRLFPRRRCGRLGALAYQHGLFEILLLRFAQTADIPARLHARRAGFDQQQLRLLGSDQLEIDIRQYLGIEQRAMRGAPRIVDAVTRAQIIESVGSCWILAARQQQGIDQPLVPDCGFSRAFQLRIQEAKIENGVMGDERSIADE